MSFVSNPDRFNLIAAQDWYSLIRGLVELNANVQVLNDSTIPAGGADGQVLVKVGALDFNVVWSNLLIPAADGGEY